MWITWCDTQENYLQKSLSTPLSIKEKAVIDNYYKIFITQNFQTLRYTASETYVQFILQLTLTIWLFLWGPILTKKDIEGKIEQTIQIGLFSRITFDYFGSECNFTE